MRQYRDSDEFKVALEGRQVADGPPFLFDASLDTLQIHEAGVKYNCIRYEFNGPEARQGIFFNDTDPYPNFFTFSPLPYKPLVFLSLNLYDTESGTNYLCTFPGSLVVPSSADSAGNYGDSFNIYPIVQTDRIIFRGLAENPGFTVYKGDLYYTIFKVPIEYRVN